MSDAPVWMTRPEAAAYLRVSVSTFDRWRNKSGGPRAYRGPGGSLRFKRSDLDAAMTPEDTPDAELAAA